MSVIPDHAVLFFRQIATMDKQNTGIRICNTIAQCREFDFTLQIPYPFFLTWKQKPNGESFVSLVNKELQCFKLIPSERLENTLRMKQAMVENQYRVAQSHKRQKFRQSCYKQHLKNSDLVNIEDLQTTLEKVKQEN